MNGSIFQKLAQIGKKLVFFCKVWQKWDRLAFEWVILFLESWYLNEFTFKVPVAGPYQNQTVGKLHTENFVLHVYGCGCNS